MKRYSDYYWKEGKPVGINPLSKEVLKDQTNYKIITDPYYKWISIEKYRGTDFDTTVYDSKLFDFRHLKPIFQTAWEKIPLNDNQSMIKDQDDRIILVESYQFEGDRCRECVTRSVHGLPISTQKVFHEEFGDSFNGVTLNDNNNHVVMSKSYDVDPETGDFSTVTEEKWVHELSHTHSETI